MKDCPDRFTFRIPKFSFLKCFVCYVSKEKGILPYASNEETDQPAHIESLLTVE